MATAAFAVSQGSIRHSEECAIYPLCTHELTDTLAIFAISMVSFALLAPSQMAMASLWILTCDLLMTG